MRSKNLPTNELGLNNEGKEIVEARMLAGMATKNYPHLLLVPSSCFDLLVLGASNHIPRFGQ